MSYVPLVRIFLIRPSRSFIRSGSGAAILCVRVFLKIHLYSATTESIKLTMNRVDSKRIDNTTTDNKFRYDRHFFSKDNS